MLGGVPSRFPFLDADGPIAYAHRGAAPDGLENTFAAIDRVIALGYTYLETDVRATSDGVAVIMHDAHLGRTTDRRGAIADLPYAEVARARVGGTEPVPRLDELLDAYPQLRVNLDVKAPSALAPLVDAIRRTKSIDRVCVGSFHDRLLPAVRQRLGERLCTSPGPRGILALRLGTLKGTAAGCAQVPPGLGLIRVVDRRFVAAAHRRGLPVHAWTINDVPEMERLLDLGVDGIMTDDALGLRDVLKARGVWSTR